MGRDVDCLCCMERGGGGGVSVMQEIGYVKLFTLTSERLDSLFNSQASDEP